MTKFIESKTAIKILKVTRQDLCTLVKFGALHPKKIHTTKNLYNLDEINELLGKKNRVISKGGLCIK